MFHAFRVALALLMLVTLAGCFESDQPLIADAESVTPLKPGKYAAYDAAGLKRKSKPDEWTVVTVEGTRTLMYEANAVRGLPPWTSLMRQLRDAYYVRLLVFPGEDGKEKYFYSLIRVDGRDFKVLDASCNALEKLAAAKNAAISTLGVANVTKSCGAPDTCFFDQIAGVSRAFEALLDAAQVPVDTTFRLVTD